MRKIKAEEKELFTTTRILAENCHVSILEEFKEECAEPKETPLEPKKLTWAEEVEKEEEAQAQKQKEA